MRGRRKRILTTIAGAIIVATAVPVGPAEASGGGGCGRPVTDASGATVRIWNYCFGPTILRVRPGDRVTFVNRDRAPHTVLGANASWGSFREMRRGDDVTYRFARPGVYPFVCTYHPGMVGAVVVGGAGTSMTATSDGGASVTRVRSSAEPALGADAAPAPSPTMGDDDDGVAPWSAAGLVAAAAIAAGAALRGRGRRQAVALPSGDGGLAS